MVYGAERQRAEQGREKTFVALRKIKAQKVCGRRQAKKDERLEKHERRLRLGRAALPDQEAMATVEYAIVTVAAVGLAGLLVFILRSDEVRDMLMSIITEALSSFSSQ